MNEEYYIKNPKKQILTEHQQFGIALGLIQSERLGAYVDSLDVGKTDYPQKQLLGKDWGITDKESATELLDRISSVGHRKLYNRLLEIYIAQDCVEAAKIDFTGTEFEDKNTVYDEEQDEEMYQQTWEDVIIHLENLDEVYELEDAGPWFGDLEDDFKVGTDAWDIGRVVFISRVCYTLGYISENEAWSYIEKMIILAKQKFKNWERYATSYVLGRAMWGGDNGDWEEVAGFAGDALEEKQSPWTKLKWK